MKKVVGCPVKPGQILNPNGTNGYFTGRSQLKARARYLSTMTVNELRTIIKSPTRLGKLSLSDAFLINLMWDSIYGKNHIRAAETLVNLTDGKVNTYMLYEDLLEGFYLAKIRAKKKTISTKHISVC